MFFSVSLVMSGLLGYGVAHAGGPLVIEGADGHTPVNYATPTVTLNIETGPLGSRSNDQADNLIRDAMNLWNQVDSSSIQLVQGADIPVDIDINNFTRFLPNPALIDSPDFASTLNDNDGLNPLVYDSDGSIIDAFFGIGQSSVTVGFSTSILLNGASHFSEGYIVVNGKSIQGFSELDFKLTIAHEMGHFIGLDHTQTDIDNTETASGFPRICHTSQARNYAIMYPFICRQSFDLHIDDITAVSDLYPDTTTATSFGEISGFFVDANGQPVLGANLYAVNTTTGEAISTVSDYTREGNGFYRVVVPPGSYTLHANSINSLFFEGSGIGPYSAAPDDISFAPPHPIEAVDFQGSTPGNASVIVVEAGKVQQVNFALDGSVPATTPSGAASPSGSSADSGGSSGRLSWLLLAVMTLVVTRGRHGKKGFPNER